VITILAKPADSTTSTSATIYFSATDAKSGVASIDCQLDSQAFAACASPKTVSNLSVGSHTVNIKATDFAQNMSVATVTWTVQAIAPTPTPTLSPTPTPTPSLSVVSFTLVNADTDTDIQTLVNGATLNLSTLPTRNLNIRANTSPSIIGSVRFGYDSNSNYHIENIAPYAFADDDGGTNYFGFTPSLGSHTITAYPYSGSDLTGTLGQSKAVTFNVTDSTVSPTPSPSATPTATPTPTPTPSTGSPSVTSVSGTLHDGNSIIINGSGFGSYGPTIQVYDSFESGVSGTGINAAGAQVGSWSVVNTGPTYSTSFSKSGTKSMKVNFANGTLVDSNQVQKNWSQDNDFYISWWQLLPSGKDVPGTNSSSGPNWKQFWLGNTSSGWPWIADFVDVVLAENFGWVIWIKADDTQNGSIQDCGTHPHLQASGVWVRLTYYMKASSSGAGAWWSQQIDGNRQINPCVATNVTTSRNNYGWNHVSLPGYARNDANSEAYYDDAYIATGPGARARIEIGNASTYTASTNLAILTPTVWTSTSVTATVRRGALPLGNVWIYVVNSNGTVNQNGYPLALQ
jgi:hypothetical protein